MNKKIIGKILNKINDPNLVNKIVSSLSFSEIQSLLIEIIDEKRKQLRINDILDQYKSDTYVKPSNIDQKLQIEFDTITLSILPSVNYHLIELSPVSPLGCCSQISNISQKKIISTIRKNEVCSDPTNVLALEASKKRNNSTGIVRLATSHRVIRSDREVTKDTFAHFRIFSVCIAGRDQGNYIFENNAIGEVIQFYDKLLSKLILNEYNFTHAEMIIKVKEEKYIEKIKQNLVNDKTEYNNFQLELIVDKKSNWNYYSTIRFNLFVYKNKIKYFIADGGDTDWTQKILNNKKERYFTCH